MLQVGTRELKQNPHAVMELVRRCGPAEVTVYGHPTGIYLTTSLPALAPRRFVPGRELRAALPATNKQEQAEFKAILDGLRDTEDVADPWEGRP
jgi:hypothetical protein